ATVMARDLKSHRASAATIRSVLRRPHEVHVEGEVERLLTEAGPPKRRLARARAAILRERLRQRRVSGGWLLRTPPGASLRRQMGEAGLLRSLASLFGLRLVHFALLMTAWGLLGGGAFYGQIDYALVDAWAVFLVA